MRNAETNYDSEACEIEQVDDSEVEFNYQGRNSQVGMTTGENKGKSVDFDSFKSLQRTYVRVNRVRRNKPRIGT